MPATPPIRSKPVSRRTVLKAGGTLLLSVLAPMSAQAAQILAVRVWPAEDYTRVTLENDTDLKVKHFLVPDPDRLVVDIEGLVLNSTLKSLVAKIESNDPYIKEVRVGQNRPNVVRLVFDLKEKVTPQVFTLEPVGNYKHRLIFDLYPVKAVDPIAALIEKGEWTQDDKAQQPAAGASPAPRQAARAAQLASLSSPASRPRQANRRRRARPVAAARQSSPARVAPTRPSRRPRHPSSLGPLRRHKAERAPVSQASPRHSLRNPASQLLTSKSQRPPTTSPVRNPARKKWSACSRSPLTPATAARIPAPWARAAAAKRTSCWPSPSA